MYIFTIMCLQEQFAVIYLRMYSIEWFVLGLDVSPSTVSQCALHTFWFCPIIWLLFLYSFASRRDNLQFLWPLSSSCALTWPYYEGLVDSWRWIVVVFQLMVLHPLLWGILCIWPTWIKLCICQPSEQLTDSVKNDFKGEWSHLLIRLGGCWKCIPHSNIFF